MSITGTVENDIIKLPPGVHLPDGTEVSIEPRAPARAAAEAPGQTFAERYAEFIGVWEDGPTDLAAEHDHYASGARRGGVDVNGWPHNYFERVAGSMPELERAPQGQFEERLPLG